MRSNGVLLSRLDGNKERFDVVQSRIISFAQNNEVAVCFEQHVSAKIVTWSYLVTQNNLRHGTTARFSLQRLTTPKIRFKFQLIGRISTEQVLNSCVRGFHSRKGP
jgi:hypothetical protein